MGVEYNNVSFMKLSRVLMFVLKIIIGNNIVHFLSMHSPIQHITCKYIYYARFQYIIEHRNVNRYAFNKDFENDFCKQMPDELSIRFQ